MKIELLAVGKLDSAPFRSLENEYRKRLERYLPIDIHEVKEPGGGFKNPAEVIKRYTKDLEKIIAGRKYYLFDIGGKICSSEAWALKLEQMLETPPGEPVFVIGGSDGFSEQFIRGASARFSFSPMTFPHQLFRIIVLEQFYRAMTILRGEKYHK